MVIFLRKQNHTKVAKDFVVSFRECYQIAIKFTLNAYPHFIYFFYGRTIKTIWVALVCGHILNRIALQHHVLNWRRGYILSELWNTCRKIVYIYILGISYFILMIILKIV